MSGSFLVPIVASLPSLGGESSVVDPIQITPIRFDAAMSTLPGFSFPVSPVSIGLPVSVGWPGFTIPTSGLPLLPLGLALSNGLPTIDIPTIALDRIPFDLSAATTLGPIVIPFVDIPANPGFWNTSLTPSSGFFNAGGGGGSGFYNFGSAMSGFINSVSDPTFGSLSGFANFGTQLSGLLNRGTDISGIYNSSNLALLASALNSGFGNFGSRLSGLAWTGTGP